MKRVLRLPLGVLLICVAAGAFAQNDDFQPGKILSVETVDSSAAKGGTDAQPAPDVQKHNLQIELSGTIYVCRAETAKDFDLSWAQGKEVQARVKGKTMQVKRANGKIVKLS